MYPSLPAFRGTNYPIFVLIRLLVVSFQGKTKMTSAGFLRLSSAWSCFGHWDSRHVFRDNFIKAVAQWLRQNFLMHFWNLFFYGRIEIWRHECWGEATFNDGLQFCINIIEFEFQQRPVLLGFFSIIFCPKISWNVHFEAFFAEIAWLYGKSRKIFRL